MKYRCKNCNKVFYGGPTPIECPWCDYVKIRYEGRKGIGWRKPESSAKEVKQ